jgi:uncharacterized membrane protein
MNESKNPRFDTADITALSHLYRGEVYRSAVWRTRLDATTNWAVVTTGLALADLQQRNRLAAAVGAGRPAGRRVSLDRGRRYRFFDFFRIRAHILEVYFFGPILRGQGDPVSILGHLHASSHAGDSAGVSEEPPRACGAGADRDRA